MHNELTPLIPRFRFNGRLLLAETQGFTPSDWAWRPDAGGNPAHWLLGHVAHYRRVIRRKLGASLAEAAWEPRYARGSSASDALTGAPGELLDDFMASGTAIERAIEDAGPEALARPFGSRVPDGAETLSGGVSFLYFHETYHLGQLGYLRRLLGKPGIA